MKIVDGRIYLTQIKDLIIEYTKSLNRDLTFQHLTEELNDLKSKYTKPNGEILAAISDKGNVVGCVAFYKHTDKRCEMKRLYVKPEYRKLKIGQKLIKDIIELASKDGFEEIVLDTIRPLKRAIYLYKKFGFREIPAYYDNPMDDVIYMRLVLS
ncbi:MAG: GNAT family N-acetyltransferase [Clostridium sp.]|jgi:ribosomal protein S18 acetylase RimI-like enzyme|uniref:GNAT family N-acetyltransferase n=1 Tax=Clostridium sp. TaxID=1506 RepID=UPI0025C09BD9|nr:GNAT family N-acetyltransferase [Clostridium sp.]MCH3963380.1 GNAT family N-acetyltransferase [Clostridium sp.]MCI1716752.1 GNAT family N-acetyltransferase [Clostridium sp.]MCI1801064.1 GNAT family N-acetyltransferase [Clostridium sp.]MCI1814938.1 GNAT family N-acetyltransferase [Clostridium sp.]MCI1871839.1 GNAT family N-acetyltransferase [Clostridium sp.]